MGGAQSAELPPLAELDALCLDCDGTIYHAGTPIEGVQEVLQALRKQVRWEDASASTHVLEGLCRARQVQLYR